MTYADRRERAEDRQEQILELVSQGHTYEDIAAELGIGAKSVIAHMKRLFARVGAKTAAHAVRIGFEAELFVPAVYSDALGLRAQNNALRVELARVYRALAAANTALAERPTARTVQAHPFGEYLLREVA